MTRVLVFQHLPIEHPGIFRDFMRERRMSVHTVELDGGEPIPDPTEFGAVLAFGGPMNVYEEEEYPFLKPETAAIRHAVDFGVPFLGVCLGGQLLAKALGAPVTKNLVPEVGLLDIELTEEGRRDPLFAAFPARPKVVQWHSDTFAVPEGGVLLATSPACRDQAFRFGESAYGLQFHVEVTPEMAEEWGDVPEYCASLQEVTGWQTPEPLVAAVRTHAKQLRRQARAVFENFCEVARRRAMHAS